MYGELNLKKKQDIREKIQQFLDTGWVLVYRNLKKNNKNISLLRNELELEFKNNGYPMQLELNNIINKNIYNKIFEILSSKELKEYFFNLSNNLDGSDVTIFPSIHITRNYFSGPNFGKHGWHNDTLGERKYDFCMKRLKSKDYMFGKISISLQKNTYIGGNVDFAKSTFNRFGRISFRQTISNKIQAIYFKIFKKSFAISYKKLDIWFTDIFSLIINPKRVNPKPFDILAFHSQIFHRGTPPSPKGWKKILSNNHSARINSYGLLPKNINLKNQNKYIIYAHFGNSVGLESYLYDRSRRVDSWETNQNEKECWLKQYEMDLFSVSYPESKKIFDKVLKNNLIF